MTRVVYSIVEHDGGWAYKLGGVFSESYPTRELALQVCEAFESYASHLKGVHVLPVYGGQGYGVQLSALARGVQVVVGTPGRIMDHLERGSLKLDALRPSKAQNGSRALSYLPAKRATSAYHAWRLRRRSPSDVMPHSKSNVPPA